MFPLSMHDHTLDAKQLIVGTLLCLHYKSEADNVTKPGKIQAVVMTATTSTLISAYLLHAAQQLTFSIALRAAATKP